jgi:hypothetical protein
VVLLVICLDHQGRSVFNDPRYRCAQVYCFAFDRLRLDGQDVRDLPLFERKQRLATSASDRTVCTTCPTLSVGCRLIKIAALKSTKSRFKARCRTHR